MTCPLPAHHRQHCTTDVEDPKHISRELSLDIADIIFLEGAQLAITSVVYGNVDAPEAAQCRLHS
ncbi:hypothetical protein D3C81_2063210 [compost metagenome]